ncbi:uncharacterized protein M6B38_180645 [Iris pallida]|uniref:Remorin C-terminal domain-containing protein n=1 Tax=Iris pallida TaxID=29817 RepID=A0AAX6EN35_IRIPA|nr:uncharacterized protein M6B38_180645 [Iris pallida]
MIHLKRLIEETSESSSSAKSAIIPREEEKSFVDAFSDPLCNLNLKETSEFVKALPMAATNAKSSSNNSRERRMEVPSTPGRPLFSFATPGSLLRKSVPSKWDDAEKWVISSPCHEQHFPPPHAAAESSEPAKVSKQLKHNGVPTEAVLKDKFTDNLYPPCNNFRFSDPTREGFLFGHSYSESVEGASAEVVSRVHHRDVGTEITPLGSLAATRCHTPIKISSPARHNTPYDMSGPLVACTTALDIAELKDCHFAKLRLSAQYGSLVPSWSSREEEEEVSKSLRHSETGRGRKSFAESRARIWEEEERTKSCERYQREEARVQAWVNLQHAKAEERSRKLEVKIQNMRSNLEEKLMKRMTMVQRRAEEMREAAQLQHSQEILRASEHAQKMRSQCYSRTSCGCFPCSNHI